MQTGVGKCIFSVVVHTVIINDIMSKLLTYLFIQISENIKKRDRTDCDRENPIAQDHTKQIASLYDFSGTFGGSNRASTKKCDKGKTGDDENAGTAGVNIRTTSFTSDKFHGYSKKN